MLVSDIRAKDLPCLAGLLEALAGRPTSLDRLAKAHARFAANPDARLLGARLDNTLVGVACGILCPDIVGACRPFLVVENVIVAAPFRGRGVGRRLMAALEAWGAGRECSYAMLVSGAGRTEAHAFYARLGYVPGAGFKKELTGVF